MLISIIITTDNFQRYLKTAIDSIPGNYLAIQSLGIVMFFNTGVAQGQITPAIDDTNTIINQNGDRFDINGGSLSGDGSNLFHSFQEFGLDSNQIANFLSNPNIRNILSRVVGNDPSIINGLIQISGGNSNLFLLNPAGIIFGNNAQLNIPGSFTATTATGISLNDSWFNAFGENNYSQLVGDPNGFRFDNQSGVIVNTGNLELSPEQNLSLIGSSVINTGTLKTSGGNITIAAVEGTNRVILTQEGQILGLEIEIPTDNQNNPLPITPLMLPELLTGTNVNTGLTVNANGTIQLNVSEVNIPDESGTVVARGLIDSSNNNPGGNGGNVLINGNIVKLPEGLIDISGDINGGSLEVYSNSLNLGIEVNANGVNGTGGYVLFDPVTFTINTPEAATIVSSLGGGDTVDVEAESTINVNAPIDSSSQGNSATLNFQDENADNNLEINLTQPIILGATQTLTGEGTTINVTSNGTIQNGIDVAASNATLDISGLAGADTINAADLGNVTTIIGDGNNDTLLGENNPNTWNINGTNQGNVDGITFQDFSNLTGGTDTDSFTFTNAGNLDGTIDGNSGSDTLVGDDDGNTFTITGTNQGTLAGKTTGWSNIENLSGSNGEDSFTFTNAGSLSGTIDGDSGSDTLVGDDDGNTFTITGTNQGTLAGKASGWINIENLVDGNGVDIFTFTNVGSLSGTVDGDDDLDGDLEIVSFTQGTNGTVALDDKGTADTTDDELIYTPNTNFNGTDSFTYTVSDGNGGTDTDTETVVVTVDTPVTIDVLGDRDDGNDLLVGDNDGNTFTITGSNSGTLEGKTSGWSNIENLTGGGGEDSFTFTNAGSLSGTIDGNSGSDTLVGDDDGNTFTITGNNSGTLAGKTSGWSNIENLSGSNGVDIFTFTDSGSLDGTVDGDNGSDTLLGDDDGNTFTITGTNQGTLTDKTSGWINIENLSGSNGVDIFIFANSGNLNGTIDGDNGSDTLVGDDDGNTFTITRTNEGTLVGKTSGWINIENLSGSNGVDIFIFANSGNLNGTIDGDNGSDTLVGDDDGNTFTITRTNEGTLVGKTSGWSNIENLSGGTNNDDFIFNDEATLTGIINGEGGNNTVDYSAYTTNLSLNFSNISNIEILIGGSVNDTLRGNNIANIWNITGTNEGTVEGINFSNIENLTGGEGEDSFTFTDSGSLDGIVDGGGGNDTLTGDNDGNTFTITGANQGSVSNITSGWSNIENLTGGDANDTFSFNGSTVSISGNLDGANGSLDTLEYSDYTGGSVTVQPGTTTPGNATGVGGTISNFEQAIGNNNPDNILIGEDNPNTWNITGSGNIDEVFIFDGFENLVGGNNNDVFILSGGTATTIDGGTGDNTLVGGNQVNSWQITSTNSGSVTGVGSFTNIQNLTGGNTDDNFQFIGAQARIDGNIDGVEIVDTLDYSEFTGEEVTVNLGTNSLGTATGVGGTILSIEDLILPPTELDLNLDEINPVDITQIPVAPDAPPNPQVNNPLTIDPIVAQLDATFTDEFKNYLCVDDVCLDDVFNVTLNQEQQILQDIEQATGIKPALLYVVFAPSTLPPASPTASNNSALKENTSEKSQLLPEDSDELEVVLVTAQGSPVRRRLGGITRKQVLEVTRVFHSTITNTRRPNAYLEPSQQLYQWIVAPVEEVLQTKEINNIAFLMDQGLRSLPLAALHNGNGFLIEKYSVGLMPSISLTDTRYVSVKDLEVLAMGADEFTDQNPLPEVPKELSTITEELWSGKSFLNEDFTINNLQQIRSVTPFGIVHLATHGEFRNGKPTESYIQLWNEKLGLDQIRQLGLHNPPVELMVLSACRTALGDKEAELGFAGLAVQAGVKSAVGSLWSVSDEGTLGLMTIFYEELKKAPIKAEALRQAQLAIISGEVQLEDGILRRRSGDEITVPPVLAHLQKTDLTHPYYWSAFTLIGNPW